MEPEDRHLEINLKTLKNPKEPDHDDDASEAADSEDTLPDESLLEKVERLRDRWMEQASVQEKRTLVALNGESQEDLRLLNNLGLSSFDKFSDLRERLLKEQMRLEACLRTVEQLCHLSNKASMSAREGLRKMNASFMPEKNPQRDDIFVPEDTDQPEAGFATLHLRAEEKASGSSCVPEIDVSGLLSRYSPEEIAQLQ
ncbi:unnamed protein product, partial [Symbiodinium sp. CCMP2592]